MRTKWIAAGLAGLLAAVLSPPAGAVCQQPVYVIAHRCNTLGTDAAGNALGPAAVVGAQKVNAIEADFTYGRKFAEPKAWYVEHDDPDSEDTHPIFAWSTKLDDWLEDAKKAVGPDSPLALIIFDIKAPEEPLADLYRAARAKLGPDINLLFSIGDYEKRFHFYISGLADLINADPRAAAAIDYLTSGENQWMVHDFFRTEMVSPIRKPPIRKYWFGDGYNAASGTPASVFQNVADGVALRDSTCDAFHGVYTWTYERESSIRGFLDPNGAFVKSGVNGIMVNADECYDVVGLDGVWQPREAVAYAKTLPGRKFVTPTDNPFEYVGLKIFCPAVTAECNSPGGVQSTDTQITNFLKAPTSSNCDGVEYSHDATATFYDVDTETLITFTGTDDDTPACPRTASCQASIMVRDTKAPEMDCPDDFDVNSGAVETFSSRVTFADACDPSPRLVCDPPGTPLGTKSGPTHRVTCTATDAHNLQASCSFNVTVLTPAQMVGNLRAGVTSVTSLNEGQKNGLRSELGALLDSIARDNVRSACGQIQGFLAKIGNWVAHGHLTAAEGQPMLTTAGDLRNHFACARPK